MESLPGLPPQERHEQTGGYFFLMSVCLANAACFFASAALLALACFCVDFFWFDFGDLSPMILFWFLRFNPPAAY